MSLPPFQSLQSLNSVTLVENREEKLAEIAEEIQRPSADLERLRLLLREVGVPPEHRVVIWQQFLGVYKKSANLELWDSELNLTDQHVIKADCLRTRPKHESLDLDFHFLEFLLATVFKQPEVLVDLEVLLTLYCKRRTVNYTQGLNELMAVFFLTRMDKPAIFNCFYALLGKFLPNTFRGEGCQVPHQVFFLC